MCRICEMDGNSDNMFVGNFAIAHHIVIDHVQFCKCAHCDCSLPDEDGIFTAHMEQCPCPGSHCPFVTDQYPACEFSYPE